MSTCVSHLLMTWSLVSCRLSPPGATPTCVRLAQPSRTSRRTFGMASSSCCSWRSSLASSCPNQTVAGCVSTRSPTSTRPCSSSRAKGSSLSPSALKVYSPPPSPLPCQASGFHHDDYENLSIALLSVNRLECLLMWVRQNIDGSKFCSYLPCYVIRTHLSG